MRCVARVPIYLLRTDKINKINAPIMRETEKMRGDKICATDRALETRGEGAPMADVRDAFRNGRERGVHLPPLAPVAVGDLMDKTIRPGDRPNRVKPRHRSIRIKSDCN